MVFTVDSMHRVVFTCGIYQDVTGCATGRNQELQQQRRLNWHPT